MDTLSGIGGWGGGGGGQLYQNNICFPSEKRSSLKGKNLLPLEASSVLLQILPFQKGIFLKGTDIQERKQSQRLCPLLKW